MRANIAKVVWVAWSVLGAAVLEGRAAAETVTTEPITSTACLRKIALDLTDRGPTPGEVVEVAEGRRSLGELADDYMSRPAFEQVVFNWYRQEFPPTGLGPEDTDSEEPSRIATHVVINDLDYRGLLTATYTVDADGAVREVDGRPAAGLISTQHYMSARLGAYRRAWAAYFMTQFAGIRLVPVTLPPDDMADHSPTSLAENPQCASCHVHPIYGIDPLASFAVCFADDGLYDPDCAEPEASFLTADGRGVASLGAVVSESREFKSQAITFFFRQLFGRDLAKTETDFYLGLVDAFEAGELRVRPLLRAIVTSEAYCAR